MKTLKLILPIFFTAIGYILPVNAQFIEMKFTALFNADYVNIDSIRITNITHPGDTVLFWPDTTLILGSSGISELESKKGPVITLQLCSANPVVDLAIIQLRIPSNGNVILKITDLSGRVLQEFNQYLVSGEHIFRYLPSTPGISLISAHFESNVKSLKIVFTGKERVNNKLIYSGTGSVNFHPKSVISTLSFAYSLGDSLLLKGWYNGNHIVLKTATQTSSTFPFIFVMNVPCPGLAQFSYGGQIYNTVQIGTQCWMKENLNIGTFVSSINTGFYHSDVSNNNIIEKYCSNNDPANCIIYGGLYDWDEMMQYSTISGIQGICPNSWHIPTDSDWCTLTTYLDPTLDCGAWGLSGTKAGGKLKEAGTSHWAPPNGGATNESGFSSFGADYRDKIGTFYDLLTYSTYFWSSSQISASEGIGWDWSYFYPNVYRGNDSKQDGFSVRCVKD